MIDREDTKRRLERAALRRSRPTRADDRDGFYRGISDDADDYDDNR